MDNPTNTASREDRLALLPKSSLRESLIAAFANIVGYACSQTSEPDPVRAVHEFRKAVRRARALLKLMRDIMGTAVYQTLTTTLRDIHRSTSDLRDRDVMLKLLQDDSFAEHEGAALLIEEIRADQTNNGAGNNGSGAHAREDAQGDAGGADDSGADRMPAALVEGSDRLSPLVAIWASGLPRRITWSMLSRGLSKTYRRAQRRLPAAAAESGKSGDDEAIHDFRKRVKELMYQVELFAEVGHGQAQKHRKHLTRLSESLGGVIDMSVLEDYASQHPPQAALDKLIKTAISARKTHHRQAIKQAHKLLDRKTKLFVDQTMRGARRMRH